MRDEEDHLLAEFKLYVDQHRTNLASDCPSKDDVLVIFVSEYLNAQRKMISELSFKLDIAESRLAIFNNLKSLGVVDE
jgi:hypothetical protein